jgi:hypothetical protein
MRFSSRLPVTCLCTILSLTLTASPTVANPNKGADVQLSFAGSATTVAAGESVVLSWASLNARHCFAFGDWSGKQATEGTYATPPLDGSKSFGLECKSGGSTVSKVVEVSVQMPAPDPILESEPVVEPAPEPISEPAPALALHALDAEVRTGEYATLSWSGTSVDNCRASGAWSGTRAASGTETIGPLAGDASFTLTCDSAAGNLVAMTSVLVTDGGTSLTWVAPEQNVDGSPLTDLQGYRIYVGTASRSYTTEIDLPDPEATNYFVELPRGEYYVAMKALDGQGNESDYSNEVVKAVN